MILDRFEKKFGKKKQRLIECINTDTVSIPVGHITEIRGKPASGKVFFSLKLLQSAFKDDYKCVIVDSDHTFDVQLLDVYNINKEKVYIANPLDFIQSFELLFNLLERKDLGVFIVINSILSLLPQDKQYEQVMANFDHVVKLLQNSKNTVIVLNPYTETRYNLVNDFANFILYLKKRQQIKKNERILGHFIDCKILKNIINLRLSEFSCKLLYDNGIVPLDRT